MSHSKKIQAAVFLTNRCNAKCQYCLTGNMKNAPSQTIDPEFVKIGLRDFFERFGVMNLRFYATGEPTMAFAEMQDIAHFVRTEFPGVPTHLELQSSGYWQENYEQRWNKAKARWIAENIDTVWISLDGPPDVHDQNRILPSGQSTRPIVEANLKYLLDCKGLLGRPFVGVRPTITTQNVNRMREMIDYYNELGVKFIWMHHEFEPISDHRKPFLKRIAKVDLVEMAKNYVDVYQYARDKNLWAGNFLIVNFDGKNESVCRTCHGCPHFTYDGYISACDMAYHSETPLQELLIGKWDQKNNKIKYFEDRIQQLKNRRPSLMEKCRECMAAQYCAGGCIGETYFETGDTRGHRLDHCAAIRYLVKHLPVPLKIPVHHP